VTDGQSTYLSWCRASLLGPWPDFFFSFLLPDNRFLFRLGRPLWGEDGSVICSAICQWSESRRTHNHTLLSHLRLLGSLSVASYDSLGLRCRYFNPPPHGENAESFNVKAGGINSAHYALLRLFTSNCLKTRFRQSCLSTACGAEPLVAMSVPTFADRCHTASVTDPYGRILFFLDRSHCFFFQAAPQLYSRGWIDPVPDPLLLIKSGSTGNATRTSDSDRNSDH
jgi:hypothetical protein